LFHEAGSKPGTGKWREKISRESEPIHPPIPESIEKDCRHEAPNHRYDQKPNPTVVGRDIRQHCQPAEKSAANKMNPRFLPISLRGIAHLRQYIPIAEHFMQLFGRCIFESSVARIALKLFMRWRILLILSLLANVLLAAGLVFSPRHVASAANLAAEETSSPVIKTNVEVRRQFLSWSHVESTDYATYIANLRSIGCPEQTIRDIIIADVNALYAKRRATEIISPQQEWWRSEPSPQVVKLAADKYIALDKERRALLTKLLGPDWEGGDLASLPRPTRPGVELDGPLLGNLPIETKQAVANISAEAQDRMQAYLQQMRDAGKDPDPATLARLRQETRNQLANVLAPAALEEYLLRYSQTANDMRANLGKLKYFNATPDEFRAMFRASDSIDQQIQLLGTANDPMTAAQRASLEQQRDSALKLALGQARYQQYQKLQDPLYQQAMATAIQNGDPNTADAIYGINLAAQAEQNGIQSNPNLTDAQKAVALKQLEADQLAASTGQPLPDTAPPPQPQRPTQPHVMGKTETAAGLSKLYGISLNAIQAVNPSIDVSNLKPGDVIRLPAPPPTFSAPQLVVPPSTR
jgi:LysM repeat protein